MILWLSGELDRATATLLEQELDAAQVGYPVRRIVDLTGLVVIDSVGLSTSRTRNNTRVRTVARCAFESAWANDGPRQPAR